MRKRKMRRKITISVIIVLILVAIGLTQNKRMADALMDIQYCTGARVWDLSIRLIECMKSFSVNSY